MEPWRIPHTRTRACARPSDYRGYAMESGRVIGEGLHYPCCACAGRQLHPSASPALPALPKFCSQAFEGHRADGPFAESKELIAGFWFWQVKSLEEAIEWVKRCPVFYEGEADIEIRQVFEPEDFASAFNDEEIQKEKQFRARMAANAAKK
jgi:hypothetical protein